MSCESIDVSDNHFVNHSDANPQYACSSLGYNDMPAKGSAKACVDIILQELSIFNAPPSLS